MLAHRKYYMVLALMWPWRSSCLWQILSRKVPPTIMYVDTQREVESTGHTRRDLGSGRGMDVEREVKEMSRII